MGASVCRESGNESSGTWTRNAVGISLEWEGADDINSARSYRLDSSFADTQLGEWAQFVGER